MVSTTRGGMREVGLRLCWVGKSVKKAVMESGGMRRTEKACDHSHETPGRVSIVFCI